jgi:hypothetical protein
MRRARSIEVSVATHKPRFSLFLKSFDSIVNDVDMFSVHINGDDDDCLDFAEKIWNTFGCNVDVVNFPIDRNYGDRAKFLPLKGYDLTGSVPDYLLTIDDDIIYPRNYIERMIEFCHENNGNPVGVHAATIFSMDKPLRNYFKDRLVTHFCFASKKRSVNCLGTGTLCFSPKVVPIKFDFFEKPNMADCYFALFCQMNKIPMTCINRDINWLLELSDDRHSLWSLRGDGKEQTEVINQVKKWVVYQ